MYKNNNNNNNNNSTPDSLFIISLIIKLLNNEIDWSMLFHRTSNTTIGAESPGQPWPLKWWSWNQWGDHVLPRDLCCCSLLPKICYPCFRRSRIVEDNVAYVWEYILAKTEPFESNVGCCSFGSIRHCTLKVTCRAWRDEIIVLGGGFTVTCLKIRHAIVEFPLMEYSWLLNLKIFFRIVELSSLISSRYLGFSFQPAKPTLQ